MNKQIGFKLFWIKQINTVVHQHFLKYAWLTDYRKKYRCHATRVSGKSRVTIIPHPDWLKQLSHSHFCGDADHYANEPETKLKQFHRFIQVSFQFYFSFISHVRAALVASILTD
jgi:hypothetical protein